MSLTTRLATFAAEAEPAKEPLHAGRRTLVNAVTVAAGGSTSEAARIAMSVTSALGDDSEATVIGHGVRRGALAAAFINGISAHVDDFDDTHFETIVHPGASVVPAALATAELRHAPGSDLLAAIVVGVEVALRLGLTIYPIAFDTGWHMSGAVGPIGAAAAAGRVLGLDANTLAHALAIAEAQGAGTQEALGTMTKSLHLGKAAANGVAAALAAARGATAPADALDRFPQLFAGNDARPARAVHELGRVWEIERNAFKPYACGVVSHAAIDGAIELRRAGCDWRDVRRIWVRANPIVLDVMGVRRPTVELEAKFSVFHCVAVGLRYGAAGPLQYVDEIVCDPEVVALRDSVEVALDPNCRVDEAEVTAELPGGALRTAHVAHARSSADAPLSNGDLREKAHTVADSVLGEDRVDRLVDELFDIDAAASVSELLQLTVPENLLSSQ